MERPSIPPRSPDGPEETSRPGAPRQTTGSSLNRLGALLREAWLLDNDPHGRRKRRLIAASAAAFAVVVALSIGEIGWRAAVMVAGADLILTLSGDMLDSVWE